MSKLFENETMTEKDENKFINILTNSFSLNKGRQMIFIFLLGHFCVIQIL